MFKYWLWKPIPHKRNTTISYSLLNILLLLGEFFVGRTYLGWTFSQIEPNNSAWNSFHDKRAFTFYHYQLPNVQNSFTFLKKFRVVLIISNNVSQHFSLAYLTKYWVNDQPHLPIWNWRIQKDLSHASYKNYKSCMKQSEWEGKSFPFGSHCQFKFIISSQVLLFQSNNAWNNLIKLFNHWHGNLLIHTSLQFTSLSSRNANCLRWTDCHSKQHCNLNS